MAKVWQAIYVDEADAHLVDKALQQLAKDLPSFDYDEDWDVVEEDDEDLPG